MKTNIVIDISAPIPYLTKFWFSSCGPKCCWPFKLQDSLEEVKDELYFWHPDKYRRFLLVDAIILGVCLPCMPKFFYRLIVSLWVRIDRYAWITQNNKFSISLQYLKKEVSFVVDFLHADKHESFLQIYMIFDGDGKALPKFSK